MVPTRPDLLFGGLFVAAGLALVALGAGVVPVDPASVHAPGWVLALCGAVFGMGGLAALAHRWPAVQSAAVGVIWLAFGVIGGWVALFGSAEQFSGGAGVLPRALDVLLARGLFGLGAVLCLAVFIGGTVRLVRRARSPAAPAAGA
ncbi:hypothetical protein [Rubrivirga sp. IMCC45206]|uniref:hypothetical protein n=1 Tax=Rubrivirga sp. IMCC45206 TaxID=3391614 RepID=UPI00398FFB37